MTDSLTTNTQRLVRLFEEMRHAKPDTAMQHMQDLGLSFSHFRAMCAFLPDRTLSMKELADALKLTPPSVTALTRRLVQTGMVRRETHADDSRISLLSLTNEGQSLLDELYQQRVRSLRQLLEGLTPNEQELFLDLLERAVHALQNSENQ